MAADASASWRLGEVLRDELTPYPGRAASVARQVVCCTCVVIVWMVWDIPLPAYAAYIVLLASGRESSMTLVTALGALIAATIALTLSLALYALDASEPAVRVPLMAGATFAGMYLSRTISVGPIAFLVGFLLVVTQTLIDDATSLEHLTRLVLWLWVVVVGPATLTTLVDLALGKLTVGRDRAYVRQLLDTVAKALRRPESSALSLARVQIDAITQLWQRRGASGRAGRDPGVIAELDELVLLISRLPGALPASIRAPLAAACDACRAALDRSGAAPSLSPGVPPHLLLDGLAARERVLLRAIADCLTRIANRLSRASPDAATDASAPEAPAKAPSSNVSAKGQGTPPPKRSFFVPDAFTNPEHAQFAIKATLATMATYLVYSGVDWPGIRTCLVTCFFVALSSVGETGHKLTLRLSGALSGGLLAGLCIVYVLPHMTDIGQLALLIAAVTALSAWISTSSETLSYAGMQMAFAFFVGVLHGYGPTDDLTALRDRVAGILLGNVAIFVVFSTLWPVSVTSLARRSLAKVLALLSDQLSARSGTDAPSPQTRLSVARALSGARQLIFLHFFEAGLVAAPAGSAAARWGLDAVEEIAAATSAVVEEPADIGTLSWYRAAMGAAAARLRTQASLWSDTPARDAAQRHDAAEGVRSSGPDGSSWLLLPDQGPDSEAIALLRASVDRISTHGR